MENVKNKITTAVEGIVEECREIEKLFEELNSSEVQGIFSEQQRLILQNRFRQIRNFVESFGWNLEMTLLNDPMAVSNNTQGLIDSIDNTLNRKG